MESISITVALQDESRGYAISPSRVPLSMLSAFTAEVQAFVRGSKEVDPAELDVAIVEGSLAVEIQPLFAPQLEHDIRQLLSSPDLSRIDAKRRMVIERWQA